jgi:hypothetical protein
MNELLEEGNLQFDFSTFQSAERFDDKKANAYGLKAVDFVVEDTECLYFVEVKDFQNPYATKERRKDDYEMLIASVSTSKALFPIEMGMKIKDSLLRKYSAGVIFSKKIVYLLFVNLDNLGEFERGLLMAKISGHIPTGLNDKRFPAFTSINFALVNAEQLKNYGIICTRKTEV